MRAVVLEAPGQLAVRDVAPPEDDSLVTVRVEQVGVCGTDRKVVESPVVRDLPRIIGHELVGRVEAGVGAGMPVGQRVLVDPSTWCGRCRTCRLGLVHLCPSGGLMGRDVDGGLGELVAVPAERLHEVPAAVGADDAALLQVLGTCVHATRDVHPLPAETAVVVGLGVSGLLLVQLLAARGATVVGVGRSEAKRALAASLGASVTCTPQDAPETVAATSGREGASVVVEAVGSAETVSLGVALAGAGATLVVFGIPAGAMHEVPLAAMYKKELRTLHPRAALGADYDDAIALMAAGRVRGAPIVSDRAPLEEAPAMFATWPAHPGRLKVVFDVAGR